MLSDAVLRQYAVAHIRLYSQVDTSRWTDEQVIETMATLPAPIISPDDWAKRTGYTSSVEKPGLNEVKARQAVMGNKVMRWANRIASQYPKKEPVNA